MSKSTKNISSLLRPNLISDGLQNKSLMDSKLCERKLPTPASLPTIQTPIRRRSFLGMGLFGVAGLTFPPFRAIAHSVEEKFKKSIVGKMFTGIEKTYWDRTDQFEVKKELLKSAWDRKDYQAVRALTNSLRVSTIQAQIEEENPGLPVSGSAHYGEVLTLPPVWRTWAQGWNYYKVLNIREKNGFERIGEPIEALLGFNVGHVKSLKREIRVAQLSDGKLTEVISQVFGEVRRGKEWFCNLLFLAKCQANKNQIYLVFYGNSNAELPEYQSDLVTNGEEYKLDIENNFFKVKLSRQTGQIQTITLKRNDGFIFYAGGDGHGEPGGFDWAHDYMAAGGFQKFRTSLWDKCPDYEIVRGPVCTIVRRWGFPYSPLHPLFSPSRLNIDIEYRFYTGLPYFFKSGSMTALKDLEIEDLRDDEWVFPGQTLPEIVWIGPDGKVNIGKVDSKFKDNLWGMGFFNKETSDSFIGLFLEHGADGISNLRHSGAPNAGYFRFHGQNWSRHALPPQEIPAGAVVHQKNAYVTLPFTATEGPSMIEKLRNKLLHPLEVLPDILSKDELAQPSEGQLARSGEKGDSVISKKLLWEALENCKDPQLYTADISIVELGLVYDLRVEDYRVKVVIVMPHRGRPLAGFFTQGYIKENDTLSVTIPNALLKVPGVQDVIVDQSWYPAWNSNLITDEGRIKLEI